MRVRYKEFSGHSPWITCVDVRITGDTLVIVVDALTERWVPMHVVRGVIEVERDEVPPAAPPFAPAPELLDPRLARKLARRQARAERRERGREPRRGLETLPGVPPPPTEPHHVDDSDIGRIMDYDG